MVKSAAYFIFLLLCYCSSAWGQVERTTLRSMVRLKNPSPQKIYRVTDADKQGDWEYDNKDTESVPNAGTILESTNRAVKGRFKRIFDYEEGVNIDWFLSSSATITQEAFEAALQACERVNFSAKTYQIGPIVIRPQLLARPQRLKLYFQNTTLQASNDFLRANVIRIEDIPELGLMGNLTLLGNAKNIKIGSKVSEAGEAFLHIVAPANYPNARLEIGSITIRNTPMCGINIFTHNDGKDTGYDRIMVKAFREINGFNGWNIQQDDFAIWGVNVRGAHRAVIIDSLYAQQDNEPWGDAPIEKPFYTFTFENQVDPTVHKRKDSLYIKHLYAQNPCAMVLYTQAINHVLVDNYVIDGALRKPKVADEKAYPTMLRTNLSWVGSKHTWTSYKSPNSSFRIKKLLIKNTNPVFMSESSVSDITGLWLNKAIIGAVFEEIETDVRLKFYGDGFYSNFPDVPDGRHRVGTFVSRIPAKRNYVQPLGADLTIDNLRIARGAGVKYAMGNAKIGAITQENGSKAVFENRENKFKNQSPLYDGFIVESCQATDIVWKFNWDVRPQDLTNDENVKTGERYEFKNFTGNNFLQTNTTVTAANGSSVYVSAFKYDADASVRTAVQKFAQFVEFNWSNVTMKLSDASPSDLTRRLVPTKSSKEALLLRSIRTKSNLKGWKYDWKPSTFNQCVIE